MKRAILIALACLTLTACGVNRYGFKSGNDAQFAKPADLGAKIEVTTENISGREYQFTDEFGSNWVKVRPGGVAIAGKMGESEATEPGASWTVRDGNLCLKGKVWWRNKGNCMQFYGSGPSLSDTRIMRPTWNNGPNGYYPSHFVN